MYLPRVVVPPPHRLRRQAGATATRRFGGEISSYPLGISRLQRQCKLIGSPRVQPSLRLCKQVSSPQQGATGVLRHPQAPHLDRLRQGAPSGDHRRSLEHLLLRPKERYKQNARMHRSVQAEPAHLARAPQDGGLAHHPTVVSRRMGTN